MLNEDEYQLILLKDEGVLGVVLNQSAHVSRVAFLKNGMQYVVMVENDDLASIEIDDLGIGVED